MRNNDCDDILQWVTLLMILLASVLQNTLYLTGRDQIFAILSTVMFEALKIP